MRTAAAAVETELWNHNYTFINHQHFTTHILPAQLIGPLVVVMPHVQRSIAKLGYCLVLQESISKNTFPFPKKWKSNSHDRLIV
jgi:hypothetical protein